MPQELHVLCCYACKMFQVDIVKKSKKWQCKVCNEKQSVQRVYFQGTGKDCRACVQKLNATTHTQPEIVMHIEENTDTPHSYQEYQANSRSKKVQSKWTKYLDSSIESTESDTAKATVSFNIDCKQTTVEVDTSEHLEIDYTIADDTVVTESHGENDCHSHARASQDVSVESEEACNISVDCRDKLNEIPPYNTRNVEVEKSKYDATIKSKSIFDNNEDIDCALDF